MFILPSNKFTYLLQKYQHGMEHVYFAKRTHWNCINHPLVVLAEYFSSAECD